MRMGMNFFCKNKYGIAKPIPVPPIAIPRNRWRVETQNYAREKFDVAVICHVHSTIQDVLIQNSNTKSKLLFVNVSNVVK